MILEKQLIKRIQFSWMLVLFSTSMITSSRNYVISVLNFSYLGNKTTKMEIEQSGNVININIDKISFCIYSLPCNLLFKKDIKTKETFIDCIICE